MMERNFMKTKAFFMMCMIALQMIAFASPAKSLLGMKNAMTNASSSEKWQNPYITDGLVAMYDAEWNAGPGQHNANAIVWKDLVGGIGDMEQITSFVPKWTANVWDPRDARSGWVANPIADQDISSSLENYIYIEIACYTGTALQNGSASLPAIFFSNRTKKWSSGLFQAVMASDGIMKLSNSCVNGLNFGTFQSINAETNGVFAGSISVKNSQKIYIDGGFCIGRPTGLTGNYNTCGLKNGRIHCIRIYSRALTAEEREFNSAIDKERFGF